MPVSVCMENKGGGEGGREGGGGEEEERGSIVIHVHAKLLTVIHHHLIPCRLGPTDIQCTRSDRGTCVCGECICRTNAQVCKDTHTHMYTYMYVYGSEN